MQISPTTTCFITQTQDLLKGIRQSPTMVFYSEHKEAFGSAVEKPMRDLFSEIAERMPESVTEVIETHKRIMSRFSKNDYGQGGAWPFYWGAFYPKSGKRQKDAQLFVSVDSRRLAYGFYLGEKGSEAKVHFVKSIEANRDELLSLIAPGFDAVSPIYGTLREDVLETTGEIVGSGETSFAEWIASPSTMEIDLRFIILWEDLLSLNTENLADKISEAFNLLFPLLLLTLPGDPMPAIRAYLKAEPPSALPPPPAVLNPMYTLAELAAETFTDLALLERWVRGIQRKGQAILYGPPGTGKTFVAQKLARHLIGGTDGFTELVQFHPAYSYEDFMQGIRPESKGGQLSYPLRDGRFLDFCKRAASRKGLSVLVIDEINRARLSQVFGELMYLLEYREAEIPLAGGGRFRIPQNVRLLGTMNTADRSIALVDHALRRRFAFLELRPNHEALRAFHQKQDMDVEGLIGLLQRVNVAIADPHYEIGISFFLRKSLAEELEDIWCMEILPYLEEYFFDKPAQLREYQWDRVRTELGFQPGS